MTRAQSALERPSSGARGAEVSHRGTPYASTTSRQEQSFDRRRFVEAGDLDVERSR
jgi:hypothetical protein